VKAALSSLVVGDRIVSRCEDGLLEAEFALFDRAEVMLSAAAAGQGVHEKGYMTTAGYARIRLEDAGLSAGLAHTALRALGPEHLRVLARTPAVRRVVEQLGPYEAFEGGTFVAASGRYLGTWLALDALAQTMSHDACIALQALHLFLVVDELPEDSPVRLFTAGVTLAGRPGERTWRKVDLDLAADLPSVLSSIPVPSRSQEPVTDEADMREDMLGNLRARAASSLKSLPRLRALASQFAEAGRTPPAGTAAGVDALPQGLGAEQPDEATKPVAAENPAPGAAGTAADLLTLLEEFRSHSQGLRGEYHIKAVAEFLSSMAGRPAALPDLNVLAARAWLAAGEPAHARHFAKKAIEDPRVADSARLTALEILESTPPTNESMHAPPAAEIQPTPVVVISSEPDREAPTGASLPPYAQEARPLGEPEGPEEPAEPVPAVVVEPPPPVEVVAPSPPPEPPPRTPLPPPPRRALHLPSFAAQPAVSGAARSRYVRPDIVETMSLPPGADDSMLPPGARPMDPAQTRIAMTRLARDIGRDYRLWYGTTLKTDLLAIDAMQRHLRRRFQSDPPDEASARQLEKELMRHGALLSEILARMLGAEWVDVTSEHPGQWAMSIPRPRPRIGGGGAQPNHESTDGDNHDTITLWPIGRVYRFYKQGHRESDLVAFYLDLETYTKRG
jgi:hypothetical protein